MHPHDDDFVGPPAPPAQAPPARKARGGGGRRAPANARTRQRAALAAAANAQAMGTMYQGQVNAQFQQQMAAQQGAIGMSGQHGRAMAARQMEYLKMQNRGAALGAVANATAASQFALDSRQRQRAARAQAGGY